MLRTELAVGAEIAWAPIEQVLPPTILHLYLTPSKMKAMIAMNV